MYSIRSPHLHLAQSYWITHLRPGDAALDATCGNGHDTLTLAQILLNHPQSTVLGFDIQSVALEKTHALLKAQLPKSSLDRILLHRRCHSELHVIPLPLPLRLIVYNLGYLPGGDKSCTTQTSSTMQSLRQALKILAEDGALSITCYPGHLEGAKEEEAILSWAQTLAPERWQVCYHRWINRPSSPTFFWIKQTISS